MDEPPYTCETSEIMNKLDMGEIPETPAKEQGYSPLDAASCSRSVACEMLPVPIGALIQPWHYWFTPELSMTEAERSYYHGHPCQGEPLSEIGYGKLFELRISNA
jgi:hypothetical protein